MMDHETVPASRAKGDAMNRFVVVLLMCWSLAGCSIYRASTAPGHVPVGSLQPGSTRAQVEQILGSPVGQYTDKEAVYEFTDGHAGATKWRILLYLAGDFFTLGLAEVIFWPLELKVLDGQEGKAIVTYRLDGTVEQLVVKRKDGTAWTW